MEMSNRQITALPVTDGRPARAATRGQSPEKMGIDEQELAWRKEFLELRQDDVERLTNIRELAAAYADPVIQGFYKHLLAFEQGRAFFKDPDVLERVKQLQVEYFLDLTGGEYDLDYVKNRLGIGTVHERIGLPFKLYLGMYSWYLRAVAVRLFQAFPKDPDKALAVLLSLTKLVFLDLGLAMDTYLFQREQTIRKQQEAIREQELIRALSTPVLPVRDRLLVLPIIGVIDSDRARQLTEQLLTAIRDYRARAIVMDITGVPIVDSKVANHFLQTVEAARLMGAVVIVTGLSPEIAQTLVRIGVDLGRLRTMTDLRAGLEEAERLLGYAVIQQDERTRQNTERELRMS